jgi:hypothetical protein
MLQVVFSICTLLGVVYVLFCYLAQKNTVILSLFFPLWDQATSRRRPAQKNAVILSLFYFVCGRLTALVATSREL